MILLDIETSGLDSGKCGIWQIGALEFENPDNYFLEEAKIDDEDEIAEEALKVTGKTEKELRDKKKQSQKQMILNFLKWRRSCKEKINAGQNVGWDVSFIQNKCLRYGIHDEFREVMGQRSLDTHHFAQEVYRRIYGHYLLKGNGTSDMNLTRVLELCGITDERIRIEDNSRKVTEGKVHGALEDCRLEAEAISRIRDGKNLFPEYAKYKIPRELKK